jgi:hypothetical protein
MTAITIRDLPANRALDWKAMSAIRGAGAPWVFGWIRPFAPESTGFGVVNFYQITNNFNANQMINQFQVVDVNNSAPNSNINVGVDERSKNNQ